MMLSEAQLQKIGLLSDTILYPEAVAFIRRLVNEEDCLPLPTSQVKGLQSIAESYQYDQIYRYIVHQYKERSWPENKQSISKLYEGLDKLFTTMKNKRLRDEFHLVSEGRSSQETNEEINALMAALACDFIQHMIAENGLLQLEENARRNSARREQGNYGNPGGQRGSRNQRDQREQTNRR